MSDARLRAQCEARLGTTLRGKWVLEKLVGIGGMAAVYAGAHKIGRRDAIKILHAEVAKSTEIRTRFEQEAAVANSFSHPGAVEIRDIDVTEDGCPFLVMEFLQGETLGEWARRLFEKGQEFPLEDLMRFTSELLSALGAAHAQGIVHRDIKLDNVFITEAGTVKVLDFGIARLTHGRAITVAGARLGTAAYMAPEQVRGEQVDGRADLFSVGATLFRLLTKQRIHEANSEADLFIRMGTEQAPAILSVAPEVPPDIAAIVDRSLKFKADQRYPNAAAMAADVQRVRANLGSSQQKRDVQLSRTVPLSMAVLQSAAQAHASAQSVQPQASAAKATQAHTPQSLRAAEPTAVGPSGDDGPASIGNAKTNALPVQRSMPSTVAGPSPMGVSPGRPSSASLASASQAPQSIRGGSGDSSASFKALKSSDMNLGTQAMPNLGSLISAGVSHPPASLRTQQLSQPPQSPSLPAPSDQSGRATYTPAPNQVRAALRETNPPVTPSPAKPSGPEWVPAAPGVAVLQEAPRKRISPWIVVAILGLLGLAAGAVGVLLIQGANAESSEEAESGDEPQDKKGKKAKPKTSAAPSVVAPAAAPSTAAVPAAPAPAPTQQPIPTPVNPADPSPKPAPSGSLPKPAFSSFSLPKFR
jgi:serine/threonine protein kinase